jgi:putative transcriptional regulator
MVEVLDRKRSATTFRVLVEIADRQPAVNQAEIAAAVGVTAQAVSEYIGDLVEQGYVEKEARSRYRVTNEGVDWLFQQAGDVRRFAEHVTEDVLGSVQEDAAIASGQLTAGDAVSLSIDTGLLRAEPGAHGPATGIATTDATAGEVVGVTGFEGVIEMQPGSVVVVQVPPVRNGLAADPEVLASICDDVDRVVAAGVEAVELARHAELDLETQFAPGAVAADAAGRGVDVAVITTTDAAGRITDALREAGLAYEVATLD